MFTAGWLQLYSASPSLWYPANATPLCEVLAICGREKKNRYIGKSHDASQNVCPQMIHIRSAKLLQAKASLCHWPGITEKGK